MSSAVTSLSFQQCQFFSKLLIEAATKEDNTTQEWGNVLDNLLFKTFVIHKNSEELSMRTKLSIAVIIVGAQNIELFMLAYKLTSYWSDFGGCFWIIQCEILRHALLFVIRDGFNTELSREFNYFDVIHQIKKVICTAVSYTEHEKIKSLGSEICRFVELLKKAVDPWEVYVDYVANFPLHNFVDWYLKWAQALLRECDILLNSSSSLALSSVTSANNVQSYLPEHCVMAVLETAIEIGNQQQSTVANMEEDHVVRTGHSSGLHVSMGHPPQSNIPYVEMEPSTTADEYILNDNNDILVNDMEEKESLPSGELMPPPRPRLANTVMAVVTPLMAQHCERETDIAVDHIQDRMVVDNGTDDYPSKIEMNVVSKHTEVTKRDEEVIASTDNAPVVVTKGGRPSSMMLMDTASAIASMGSGLFSILGPITQYTSETELSAEEQQDEGSSQQQ